jgi:hypothetical protein
LITQIVFDEEYKSWSFCSFFERCPVS